MSEIKTEIQDILFKSRIIMSEDQKQFLIKELSQFQRKEPIDILKLIEEIIKNRIRDAFNNGMQEYEKNKLNEALFLLKTLIPPDNFKTALSLSPSVDKEKEELKGGVEFITDKDSIMYAKLKSFESEITSLRNDNIMWRGKAVELKAELNQLKERMKGAENEGIKLPEKLTEYPKANEKFNPCDCSQCGKPLPCTCYKIIPTKE